MSEVRGSSGSNSSLARVSSVVCRSLTRVLSRVACCLSRVVCRVSCVVCCVSSVVCRVASVVWACGGRGVAGECHDQGRNGRGAGMGGYGWLCVVVRGCAW